MTSLVPDPTPVESNFVWQVKYYAGGRRRVRTGILKSVSECGRFVKIYKLSHQHWIAKEDVKMILNGKLRLAPK